MQTESQAGSLDQEVDLGWIDNITRLMDTSFRLPGTSIRFGLDPIIGLIPFAGNIITYIIAAVMILAMARYGVSSRVVAMMIGNVALDYMVGSIPLIGTIFDVGYKANYRNLKLLKAHYGEGKYTGSIWGILAMVVLGLVLTFVVITVLAFKGLVWLFAQMPAEF